MIGPPRLHKHLSAQCADASGHAAFRVLGARLWTRLSVRRPALGLSDLPAVSKLQPERLNRSMGRLPSVTSVLAMRARSPAYCSPSGTCRYRPAPRADLDFLRAYAAEEPVNLTVT